MYRASKVVLVILKKKNKKTKKKPPANAGNIRDKFYSWIGKIPLEKGMATHSSILAWRIPWTEEPGRLQSIWLQRVGHDWATKYTQHI